MDDLKKGIEYCICKVTCKEPMVAPCCGRITGCKSCVECWATNNTNCPLCREQIAGMFQLKGFEEITSFFRALEPEGSVTTVADSDTDPIQAVLHAHSSVDSGFVKGHFGTCMTSYAYSCTVLLWSCQVQLLSILSPCVIAIDFMNPLCNVPS